MSVLGAEERSEVAGFALSGGVEGREGLDEGAGSGEYYRG